MEFRIQDPDHMNLLGLAVAKVLRAGDLLLLNGPLGAGKTTLTRGIGEGLGARLAQPARAAGDHRGHARFDFHGFPLLWFFCLWLSAYPARR